MTGVETRTSAPLRMGRNEERVSPTVGGFYPMGEGAGYAGGIMSAALDGAETAILCMAKYAKPNQLVVECIVKETTVQVHIGTV